MIGREHLCWIQTYRPCRHQVLEFDYMRGRFANSWVTPRVVFTSDEAIRANQRTVSNFIDELTFRNDEGHPDRTEVQRHVICQGRFASICNGTTACKYENQRDNGFSTEYRTATPTHQGA